MGLTLESGTISGGLKQLAENVGRKSDTGPDDVDDSQTDESVELDDNQESNKLADKLKSQAAALRQQAEQAFEVRGKGGCRYTLSHCRQRHFNCLLLFCQWVGESPHTPECNLRQCFSDWQ